MSPPPATVTSRIPLSLWLRLVIGGSFTLLTVAFTGAILEGETDTGSPRFWVEVVGIPLCIMLTFTSFRAACTISVTPESVKLRFWVLFFTSIPAEQLEELRADEWDSWEFGGFGLKGDRPRGKKGLLLNATVDATGRGDRGILVRTRDGRTYRIEVADPEAFADTATTILGIART